MTEESTGVDFSEGESMLVDFSNVEDVSFEVLPAGMYECVIAECNFTHSQSSGNAMWTLVLEVEGGDHAGRKLYTHWVFEGKGLPMTKRLVKRIAPELLEAPFDPEDDEITSSMIGRQLKAKVAVGMYQGNKNNNVKDLFPNEGDGGMFE